MSVKPNLFIIGMPKCGTTALASYLQDHPDVLISVPKEPHYFDAFYDDMSLDEYLNSCYGHFNGQNIIGEATPSYLRVTRALERLARHYPQAKHIVLLRNPVDRAYSHWWMFYSRAMDELSFEEAIEKCLQQKDSISVSQKLWKERTQRIKTGQSLVYRPYLSNGYYAMFLRKYFELFDKKQLLVIQTEEFNRDTFQVMTKVCRFLEIEPYQESSFRRRNEAYGLVARRIFSIAKGLGLTRFTQSVPESVRDRIKRILSGVGKKQPVMNNETRKILLHHFNAHNSKLEELLGRRFNWN